MASNNKQVWAVLRLLSQANEEIATLGGIAESPLDTEMWMQRHLHMWPKEFAYEDWSMYQPAIRKIRLLPAGESGQAEQVEREGER